MELRKNALCYAGAGAAQLLGLAYAASTDGWITGFAKQTKIAISMDAAGTLPTSMEIMVQFRATGTTQVLGYVPSIDSVVAGVVSMYPAQLSLLGAWATYDPQVGVIWIPGGCDFLVYAKRTGGDGTTAALGRFVLLEE